MMLMPEFIVGEVSKNWNRVDQRDLTLLSQLFEEVIAVNMNRGYGLHSFSLHRLMVSQDEMNETIIAVFQRREGKPAKGHPETGGLSTE